MTDRRPVSRVHGARVEIDRRDRSKEMVGMTPTAVKQVIGANGTHLSRHDCVRRTVCHLGNPD